MLHRHENGYRHNQELGKGYSKIIIVAPKDQQKIINNQII